MFALRIVDDVITGRLTDPTNGGWFFANVISNDHDVMSITQDTSDGLKRVDYENELVGWVGDHIKEFSDLDLSIGTTARQAALDRAGYGYIPRLNKTDFVYNQLHPVPVP